KGDIHKSGGIATNIGVHFFDMLTWIFGEVKENVVHLLGEEKAAGYLQLENAKVRWYLSVDYEDVPKEIKEKGQRTYRSITVDGEEIEFSGGFTDLHTLSYQEIIAGNGYGLECARNSIQTVYDIRNSEVKGLTGDYHPFIKKAK
ncbi:MAG: Gfo/Idh/MocA family oxidoreductase, partial [Bacteroidales bacterium]|nr:Gfo/Idh/MocA family oxidoreductase [Bacteroidales bacterium]